MTVSATFDRATETETASAFAPGIDRAIETETAWPLVARLSGGTEAWKLQICQRDGTVEASVSSSTSSPSSQIAGFRMQWPLNDVGVGSITVPLSSSLYDELVEHRFLHLFIRGHRCASAVIGVPTDTLVSRDGDRGRLAEFSLFSLEALLNEALVYPSRGTDVQPPGEDRIFDWSDPARDNSDFTTPASYGTVTDANSTYPVTPYAQNIVDAGLGDDVDVISPVGYDWSADAPSGRCYFYIDHDFSASGYYRFLVAADNALVSLRIDGQELLGYTWGFSDGSEVDKILITAGEHRIAACIENQPAPGAGPTTLAVAVCLLDGGGNISSLEVGTSTAWGIAEFQSHPPGFTPGHIGEVCLLEAVARGCYANLTAGFTGDYTSNGVLWGDTWDIATKAGSTGVGTFFLKELSETYCDVEVVAGAAGGAVWNLYPRGSLGYVVPVTYTAEDFGHLETERAPVSMTAAVVRKHDGFHERIVTPLDGIRVEAGLSLGAQQSNEEADRVADGQLYQFKRAREKVSAQPLVGPSTSDTEFPGVAYWTGYTITIPATKNYTATAIRIINMTVELMDNGHMMFTPEFGDPIVPVEGRGALALAKMAPGALAGRSRATSQPG